MEDIINACWERRKGEEIPFEKLNVESFYPFEIIEIPDERKHLSVLLEKQFNEVTPDEASPSCDEDFHL